MLVTYKHVNVNQTKRVHVIKTNSIVEKNMYDYQYRRVFKHVHRNLNIGVFTETVFTAKNVESILPPKLFIIVDIEQYCLT